jgi:rubrerythrin
MLNQNIKDEESGINYYENIKKQLSSNELVELIDRIILDEIIHVETFNKLLEYVSFYKNN